MAILNRMHCISIVVLTILVICHSTCFSATIFPVMQTDGDRIRVSLAVDRIVLLAGMKIALTYNEDVLKFIEVVKTQATTSLMHVVNDNTPGKLIIVMAGAKGISGENISLIDLVFKPSTKFQGQSNAFKIEEIQFMDENLHDIQATIGKIQTSTGR